MIVTLTTEDIIALWPRVRRFVAPHELLPRWILSRIEDDCMGPVHDTERARRLGLMP